MPGQLISPFFDLSQVQIPLCCPRVRGQNNYPSPIFSLEVFSLGRRLCSKNEGLSGTPTSPPTSKTALRMRGWGAAWDLLSHRLREEQNLEPLQAEQCLEAAGMELVGANTHGTHRNSWMHMDTHGCTWTHKHTWRHTAIHMTHGHSQIHDTHEYT